MKNQEYYLYCSNELIHQEIAGKIAQIEKFVKVYDACFLMSSFAEEVKLLLARTNSQSIFLKKHVHYSEYDSLPQLKEDLSKLLENYKLVLEALSEYPLWKEKFETDINKQLQMVSIKADLPQLYDVLYQQKAFK